MTDVPPQPPPAQGPFPPYPPQQPEQPGWGAPQQPGYPPQPPPQPGWAPPPPGYAPQPGYPPQPGFAQPGWTQVGYGYGAGAPALKPLGTLGAVVSVMVGLTSLLCVAAALALFSRASLLGDAGTTFTDLVAADDRVTGMVGAQTLAMLGTGIAWMAWQYRLAKNLTAFGRPLEGGAGRAIWGWFIPIANYFIAPYQLLRAAQSTDEARGGDGVAPAALVPWWIAFGVGSLVLGVGSRVLRPSSGAFADVDEFRVADQVHGTGLLLIAVAGVLAILTVRACTARQMGDGPAAVAAPPPTTF